MSIQDFLKGSFIAGADALSSPIIQIWSGSGYTPYYFFAEAYSEDYGTTYANVWADESQIILNKTVIPGTSIWFKDPNEACTLTTAGQVVSAATKVVTLAANQWVLIANPYPESVELNSSKVDWSGLTAGTDALSAPVIQVWNGTGFTPYYYFSEAYSEDYGTTYSNVWADESQIKTSIAITPGQGFFVKSTTGATVTFTK